MTVSIRPYQAADAEPMGRLFFDSVRVIGLRGYSVEQTIAWAPQATDPARVDAWASSGRTVLVAVDASGVVLGYGDLEPDGHLDHLYCAPKVAGTGVGAALLAALIELAKAASMSTIFVEASEVARPLFLSRGFVVVERQDFEVRGVAIHNYRMEKRLG